MRSNISIVSVYVPPKSDEFTFTIDSENLIQTSSNCVLFGDFNARILPGTAIPNSSRGIRLLDFTNLANLYIAPARILQRARLQALNTQDNSLWAVQKFFKNKRSDIPSLHCTTGTAITDKQKADILAESILTNFTENERQNNDFDDDDEIVNNTVNAFLSHPPPPTAETTYPSEIISYIKVLTLKSARDNKVLLFTAVMRPILAYGCPVWGYAAKTNINILDTLQNSTIRMIVGARRYMRNDDIRNAIKINSFKSYIQKIAKNFFNSLKYTNNENMINMPNYNSHDNTKRPRRILLDSYNPP
ncbi:uncharacterized protein TNCV_3393321 [Trichonephila clavipes]|nr:uncharacterized protein TNCV_3393321 [Trichonephila clavipes]